MITVFKLVTILFFVAHYLGCIWFALSPKGDAEEGWIYLEGGILPRVTDPSWPLGSVKVMRCNEM